MAAAFPELSAPALDLVSRLVCLNPKARLTAAEALVHPYFLASQLDAVSVAPQRPTEQPDETEPRGPTPSEAVVSADTSPPIAPVKSTDPL